MLPSRSAAVQLLAVNASRQPAVINVAAGIFLTATRRTVSINAGSIASPGISTPFYLRHAGLRVNRSAAKPLHLSHVRRIPPIQNHTTSLLQQRAYSHYQARNARERELQQTYQQNFANQQQNPEPSQDECGIGCCILAVVVLVGFAGLIGVCTPIIHRGLDVVIGWGENLERYLFGNSSVDGYGRRGEEQLARHREENLELQLELKEKELERRERELDEREERLKGKEGKESHDAVLNKMDARTRQIWEGLERDRKALEGMLELLEHERRKREEDKKGVSSWWKK